MILLKIFLSISLIFISIPSKLEVIEVNTIEIEKIHEPIIDESLSVYSYEQLKVCHAGTAKTYMSWLKISPTSKQGKFIRQNMTVQEGLLFDSDGYIGVALGSYFGKIGDRFIITLSSGRELKVIKVEEKSDRHTINGCQQYQDNSVIEFVVDIESNTYYIGSNGLIANGNYNNLPWFKGHIVKILKEVKKTVYFE